MNADPGNRSSSRSTVDSISAEESDDDSSEDVAPASSATPQTPKQKGRQGADLVKDMYKIFDGSALVALGKYLLIGVMLVTHRGVQEFSCTGILNDLFKGTGVSKRILNRS